MPGPDQKTAQAVEQELVAVAEQVFGEELVSVVLYGSYLRATFTQGSSDVNVLVILSAGRPDALREFGRQAHRLLKRFRITPLVLTRAEFTTSADVFPVEYLDIVEGHKVLIGPDVTAELDISKANLRHEIEHQLRGSLVALRQLAIAAGRNRSYRKTLLRRELRQWYGSLSAMLRGLLRLKGASAIPQSPEELVTAVNEALGLESGPIVELLRGKKDTDSIQLIDSVLERLAKLVEIVDGLVEAQG